MREKIIRDPVHDVIGFQLDRALDSLLFQLINAAEFQRLRRIRQLGLASLAYPGADHSRYGHSLGVMHTARRIFGQLAADTSLDEAQVTAAVAAALLHDLGHGPFSHVFERLSGIHHEKIGCDIIDSPDTEVHRILRAHDRTLPSTVSAMLSNSQSPSFYTDVISSQLDADRLDYLLRDNLMTGARYGEYDLTWLIHAMTVDRGSNRLAITWKGVSAVEAYLQARYHMYRNVYFHKVIRSAEGMVKLTLQRARELGQQNRMDESISGSLRKALGGDRLKTQEFLELDDVAILHALMLWARGDDTVLAGLADGLLQRRLYKTIDLTRSIEQNMIPEVVAAAERAVATAGGNTSVDLFYDEPADTPYESFARTNAATEAAPTSEILICDADGKAIPFARLSPLTMALNAELTFRRLHVAGQFRDAVIGAIAKFVRK